jgi:hypothetical protein
MVVDLVGVLADLKEWILQETEDSAVVFLRFGIHFSAHL